MRDQIAHQMLWYINTNRYNLTENEIGMFWDHCSSPDDALDTDSCCCWAYTEVCSHGGYGGSSHLVPCSPQTMCRLETAPLHDLIRCRISKMDSQLGCHAETNLPFAVISAIHISHDRCRPMHKALGCGIDGQLDELLSHIKAT